jgi:hypothetical protein
MVESHTLGLTCIFARTYTTRMHGQSIEQHFRTLQRRYDEKMLRRAALRRAHLDYQRIHIGHGPGSGRVKFLLAQMHQAYYFGFSESACILSGTLLEQGLIHRLGTLLDKTGPLPFERGGERRWLQTRHDLLELELVDMLELAHRRGIIADGRTLLLAHEIRWIRNMVVHEKIPVFHERDAKYLEMSVTKSRRGKVRYARVLMEKAEVAGLPGVAGAAAGGARRSAPAEITAYFCVSRTRMILKNLFAAEQPEGKKSGDKNDESGGNLFLWTEA